MVYNNKLVVAIKVAGKVLKEFGDTVYVPFGSEYSILIKNMHTTRAVVKLKIDGKDVLGSDLLINPGQDAEIERGDIKSSVGSRFKFIERTERIENHRGIGLEDGLVSVEYQFEVERKVYTPIPERYPRYKSTNPWPQTSPFPPNPITWTSDVYGNPGIDSGNIVWGDDTYIGGSSGVVTSSYSASPATKSAVRSMAVGSVQNASFVSTTLTAQPFNDTGITVKGSDSDQKFHSVTRPVVEATKYSIVIKLAGKRPDDQTRVMAPVVSRTKRTCETCGHKEKNHRASFCPVCGTKLPQL